MRFTDSKIKALKARNQRYEIWEENGKGFGIRVSPAGRKTWMYRYRNEERYARMSLGTYPAVSLADAHEKHAVARVQLGKGIDPGNKSINDQRDEKLAPTVKALCSEYLEKWAKTRKKTWREDDRIIKKDILPAIGRKKATVIKRRDLTLLLDDIVERGAPVAANRTHALISSIFSYGIRCGVMDINPCQLVTPPTKEAHRDRVLSGDEIKKLWNALGDSENELQMTKPTRLAIKLLLVTAQRKGEMANSRWEEFDLKQRWWTIPAERSKNGLSHHVPLSGMAVGLLDELKAATPDSEWLFPSPRGRNKPVTSRSISRALIRGRSIFQKEGDEPFGIHDLRRTAASQMTKAGIPRLTVKKILNHVESDITAVYDRHSYDDEKRIAMEVWGSELNRVILGESSSNVISIKQAKG